MYAKLRIMLVVQCADSIELSLVFFYRSVLPRVSQCNPLSHSIHWLLLYTSWSVLKTVEIFWYPPFRQKNKSKRSVTITEMTFQGWKWDEIDNNRSHVNRSLHLVSHITKAPPKKKLFGCPLPPAPNFWKLEKKFLLYRSIPCLIFRIRKKGFFFPPLRIWIF